MVPGKASKTNIIKLEVDDVDDPGEFGRDDKNYEILKFNQMSNQLLLKKSLMFALHYVKFKSFIITHQHSPLSLKACKLEGSYLNHTQEVKKKQLYKCQISYLTMLHY